MDLAMRNLPIWFYIIGTVLIAVLANSLSAIWAKGDDKLSLWLIAVIIISPLVFITFGLVTSKIGVSVSSGVIDSLLTLSTMIIGLTFFHEWNRVSQLQFLGMALAIFGVFLMLFFPKTDS